MHRIIIILLSCKSMLAALVCLSLLVNGQTPKKIAISLNPDQIVGKIDSKIYGQLLEHIYHSINGGLWGEMIESRSFEPVAYKGWYIENNELVSPGSRIGELLIGKPEWRYYDITMETIWKPFFVGVPAPWSGGQSDIRFVFKSGQDSRVSYAFHMNANASNAFTLERNLKNQADKLEWQVLQSQKIFPSKSIDAAQWHKVHIHCESSVVKIYWDNQLLFNYKQFKNVDSTGGFAFFLTRTAARFKNIEIKSLSGNTLLKGFPESVLPPAVAPGWTAFGKGRMQLVKGDSRNRNYSQKIIAGKDAAGVGQGPMNLYKGEIYRGSIWAKGNGKAVLSVMFNQGETRIARQKLGVPSKVWKEYFFDLHPVISTDQATFSLLVTGGTVLVDQVSMIADAARKIGGYRPDLLQAVTSLAPTTLRWPGGSFASGYNWKWGIGPQVDRIRMPKASWDDYEQNAFGTDEFINLCRKINAEPVIVIPIGYDEPDAKREHFIIQAQEWLAYCNEPVTGKWGKIRAQNGHPKPYMVKYWEIDNEMWEIGVEKYSKILREFVPALKKIDSSIKVIACGDFMEKNSYRDSVLLFSSGKYFNYLSLHHYESPANYTKGPLNSAIKYAGVARLIAASPNPAIKIYISEWNASELDMRTGLYAAGLLNVFEKEPAIEMAAGALLLRRTDAAGWNNAFINFDYKGWYAAPNYVVTKLWREHFAPNRIELNGEVDSLNLVATRSDDGRRVYLKAVNTTNQPITVVLTIEKRFQVSSTQLKSVSANSLEDKNTMFYPNEIRTVDATVEKNGNRLTFILPKWSANVLSITKRIN